jgi:hypothetical protein
LPAGLVYSGAVVRDNSLYVIGGKSNSDDEIYRFPILNTDGDLGAVVTEQSLPEKLRAMGAVTWSGESSDHLYVLGGLTNLGAGSQNVHYTSFKNDASLNTWSNTSLVDARWQARAACEHFGE